MTINVERDFESITLGISGRLDTTTAPNLENAINDLPDDTKKIIFDMKELEYISSAGIRVILKAHKKMNGAIKITSANEIVKEVFEMTGLLETLDF